MMRLNLQIIQSDILNSDYYENLVLCSLSKMHLEINSTMEGKVFYL